MTRVYKFLAAGAIGRFSRFAWPTDGAWVEAAGPIVVGKCGVHACTAAQLAHWLDDALWEVELAGEHRDALDCVVAAQGRLVREVDRWRLGGAARFATACVERATGLARGDEARALVEDAGEAAGAGYVAVAAYAAAIVAARPAPDPVATYATERAWQSAWIAREMIVLP